MGAPRAGYGAGHDEDWKAREGSQDSRDRERDGSRSRRGEESSGDGRLSRGSGRPEPSSSKDKPADRDNRGKGAGERSSTASSDTPTSTKPSAAAKIKASPAKDESPLARDEPSLASLFSQTDTLGVKKKPPAKSFGGKKSPKSSEDVGKTSDKSKAPVSGRMGARRANRASERKGPPARSGDSGKEKDSGKEDAKVASKSDDTAKEKVSRTPSPKGSQKSGDSNRSRQSQTRASKRASRSPESKASPSGRSPTTTTTTSSSSKRGIGGGADSSRSPRKVSRSPVPAASRDRDRKGEQASRSPAPSSAVARDKKKKEEEAKTAAAEKDKKRARSRSGSHSGSESRHSSHAAIVGGEEKKRRRSSDSESQPAKLDEGDIAAAMLGDGIDDGQQEEKVFSDWSDDDDADNILMGGDTRKNEVEDLDHQVFDVEPRHRRSPATGRYNDHRHRVMDFDGQGLADILMDKPAIEKNIPNVKIVEDIQKEKPARERRRRNTDDEGYEEISSDENELDEEGERVNKRTIVSILVDINLASLMPAAKPKSAPGPLFQRYKAASVFGELGVSWAYAGESLYAEVKDTCQRQLEAMAEQESRPEELVESTKEKEEASSAEPGLTAEVKTEGEVKASDTAVKTEPETEAKAEPGTSDLAEESSTASGNPTEAEAVLPEDRPPVRVTKPAALTTVAKPEFRLYGPTSAYHRLYKARAQQKSALLDNAGLFRRALTARKDLDIRRQLCRIDPKYDQGAVYPTGPGDPELIRQCVQLFRQRRPQGLAPPQTNGMQQGHGKTGSKDLASANLEAASVQ